MGSFSTIADTSNPPQRSCLLPGGAIAGIVIGAVASTALNEGPWSSLARRRQSTGPTPPTYADEDI